MQRHHRVRDVIHRNDVDSIRRAKRKNWQPGEKYERADHVELIRFRAAAVAQHDAGAKNRALHVREQLAHHMLAEFLGARVGIVVGTIPVDRSVFLTTSLARCPGHGDRAHMAESPQSVLRRARAWRAESLPASRADSHSGSFFRICDSAMRRNGSRNRWYRTSVGNRRSCKPNCESVRSPRKIWMRELTRIFELREIHVELQRAPEAIPRFLLDARAHQQIQRIGMIRRADSTRYARRYSRWNRSGRWPQ